MNKVLLVLVIGMVFAATGVCDESVPVVSGRKGKVEYNGRLDREKEQPDSLSVIQSKPYNDNDRLIIWVGEKFPIPTDFGLLSHSLNSPTGRRHTWKS